MRKAIIYRDSKEVARFDVSSGYEVLRWFHTHCSCSMDWALKYEGYSYEIIGE